MPYTYKWSTGTSSSTWSDWTVVNNFVTGHRKRPVATANKRIGKVLKASPEFIKELRDLRSSKNKQDRLLGEEKAIAAYPFLAGQAIHFVGDSMYVELEIGMEFPDGVSQL